MSILTTRSTGGLYSATVTNGGTGYTSRPLVTVVGGGGTGAAVIAQMAGTAVESLFITNPGSGYTGTPSVQIGGGGGTGAAGVALAYTGEPRPATIFKGRFNDVYGVDGMGRGFRWTGDATVQPIGIQKPPAGPSVDAEGSGNKYVASIQVIKQGLAYTAVPEVELVGGSPTKPALARAKLAGGKVTGFTLVDQGRGYEAAPSVRLNGGMGAGAILSVGVVGTVDSVVITDRGTGYGTDPDIVFSTAQGLTTAVASARIAPGGRLDVVRVLSGGTGATTAGVTASVVGGGGTGAQVSVRMMYRVHSVTVINGGTGYKFAPSISFQRDIDDAYGSGAAATASLMGESIASVTVFSGGEYEHPPAAIVREQRAVATAIMEHGIKGTYKCCVRYLDDTPESQNGPIPSSISDLTELEIPGGASQIVWSFDHDGLEPRVTAMELWRTTANQSVVLFRVATIRRSSPGFFGSHSDALTDAELIDTGRDGYGVMPITLPSGQINARRFEVPPGNYAVACMFQDRAWYAVDTTGERPNSLLYSEVDEPESVPPENELILQENTGTPDAIVALVPVGSALLVCQSRHIYKLQYVAQPVLDASLTLVGYRGILNSRCWDTLDGVAFIADSFGLYAFDGTNEEPVSVPIDNYWRDGIIDFSLARWFHVRADPTTKIIRFFFCRQGDSLPGRALCYCTATKAWWEEQYPDDITASAAAEIDGRQTTAYATGAGGFVTQGGLTDDGAPIPYAFRTGNFPLEEGSTSRAVGVLYQPTAGSAQLKLGLHYNNSPAPRPNAVANDRGGFTTAAGSTASVLDMAAGRSPLGYANGFARAEFAGHRDARNVGGDRHVAIALSGAQGSTAEADAVRIYAISVDGVK